MMIDFLLQLFITFDLSEEPRDCLTESTAKVFNAQCDRVGGQRDIPARIRVGTVFPFVDESFRIARSPVPPNTIMSNAGVGCWRFESGREVKVIDQTCSATPCQLLGADGTKQLLARR